VLISTDWDGTEESLLSAEWQILSAAYIAQNNDFFGDWFSSGLVDLSCVDGKGYIAFRYTGSDLAYYNGVYELDEIVVSAD
ncbi:choice-of-anchor J domain-containing protein, partial [Salinimicrobium oceani]